MLKKIIAFSQKHNLFPPHATVVIGLSGGPDSVFLLHTLVQLRAQGMVARIIAAHLDHQWRVASGDDVIFCKQLADTYQVEFISSTLQELNITTKPNGSVEDLGRRARRIFLTSVAHQYHAQAIALGHHYNDQQETFFIRLIRGASLSGLASIKPRHGLFARPLLETPKKIILDFLHTNNISYLTDPTNTSSDFLRNRIRMDAIPALRSCDERFDTNFAHTLKNLRETEEFLQGLTKNTFEQIATQSDAAYHLSIPQLLSQHPAMLHRLLVHWFCQELVPFPVSTGFFTEVLKFLQQPGNANHRLHTAWWLVKKNGVVFIQKNNKLTTTV